MPLRSFWSLTISHYREKPLNIHVSFFLFVLMTLYLGWMDTQYEESAHLLGEGRLGWLLPSCLLFLFLSVLAHELGHLAFYFYYRQYLASLVYTSLTLWPFGNLDPPTYSEDPDAFPNEKNEEASPKNKASGYLTFFFLGGIFANLLIALTATALLLPAGHAATLQIFNPLNPATLTEGSTIVICLKAIIWINTSLVVINILPIFPFDGQPILRLSFSRWWPHANEEQTTLATARVAQIFSLICLIAAWQTRFIEFSPIPPWLVLTLLSVLIYFNAQRSYQQQIFKNSLFEPLPENELCLDDLLEEEIPEDDPFEHWLYRREQSQSCRSSALPPNEQAKLDDILKKLSKHGLSNLSQKDKDLLYQISRKLKQLEPQRHS
ncbi:MAG: hypothetical protein MPJ24_00830 [Pirellulaceae bacterium]|nr:hypothetical protein [Pirellulaceae bacterium]